MLVTSKLQLMLNNEEDDNGQTLPTTQAIEKFPEIKIGINDMSDCKYHEEWIQL